jgi:hypothetical protein
MDQLTWADVRSGDVVLIDQHPHCVESAWRDCSAILVETRNLRTGRRESSAHPATLAVPHLADATF